jgi:hypothetical protein
MLERDSTLEAVRNYNAIVDKQFDNLFAEAKDHSTEQKEWVDGMEKLNKKVEDYQLKSVSLMPKE